MAQKLDPRVVQAQKNQQFMALSFEQPIKANPNNGVQYAPGSTLNYTAPTVSGAWATKVTLRHKIDVDLDLSAPGSTATLNAGAPHNFVNQLNVVFGSKQISVSPAIASIFDKMEGYARDEQHKVKGYKDSAIENLLHKVPSALVDGVNSFVFDTTVSLNAIHEQSVNGIIPLFSTGTQLQVSLNLANSVTGVDPLDNVMKLTNGAVMQSVSGSVEVIVHYRDHNSMTTREALQPVIDGLPTAQIIQVPSVSPLVGGNVYNYADVKNPYPFAKIVSFVIDGKSSAQFFDPANLKGFTIDKAGNTSSSFLRYDETTGGIENYYKDVRMRFGQDISGVTVFDATTQNVSNVSSKMGTAMLNLSNDGYPATRLGWKLDSVTSANGITPRVVTFGVILNGGGIGRA